MVSDLPSAERLRPALSPLAWLRDLPPLHAGRARAYARVFLAVAVLVAVARVALTGTGISPLGFAFHSDFLSFWAASKLVLAGNPAGVYDPAIHGAVERPYDDGYFAFFYPPVYLLLCAPLALLGLQAATAAFLAVTGAAYWRVATWLLPGATVAALAYPGVVINALYGQNGFLTAALFGAGVAALRRRRALLAGAAFGCLCYKPQLALLVPLALLAAGEWRALAAAAVVALGLAAASVTAFGVATWQAFLADLPLAHTTLEQGLVNNACWVSVFRAVRMLGGGLALSYAVQAVATVGAVAAVLWASRRDPEAGIGAVLPVAAFLATPFVLVYDLVLLAVPVAWLLRTAEGRFLAWEKPVLAAAFVLPLASLALGLAHVPVAPLVLVPLLWVVLRRVG